MKLRSFGWLSLATLLGVSLGAQAAPYTNYWWTGTAEDHIQETNMYTWSLSDGSASGSGLLPDRNGVVRLKGNSTYHVRNEDKAFFESLYEILFQDKTCTCILDLTEDMTFPGGFQGNGGTVVKLNSNRVVCSGTRESSPMQLGGGQFIVSNGWFKMEAATYLPRLSLFKVYKPGVLEFSRAPGMHIYIGGLAGDGTVTNAQPKSNNMSQLQFCGEEFFKPEISPASYLCDKGPWVFTGDIKGRCPLTFGGDTRIRHVQDKSGEFYSYCGCGPQVFDTTTVVDLPDSSPRFNAGIVGLAALGGSAGTPSSLGNYDALSFFGNTGTQPEEMGFRYVGVPGVTSTRNYDTYYRCLGSKIVVDGGETGGLTLAGGWRQWISGQGTNQPAGTMGQIIFRGSNTEECVYSGSFLEQCPTNGSVIVKQGSGTWYFKAHDNRGNQGPVFVEKGTLKFDSYAERGQVCALGTAAMLSTNYWGNETYEEVPFAYQLGDGTAEIAADTATMAYVGSVSAASTNRSFAVNGAGRITAATDLHLEGAYAAAPGVNALVLGGDTARPSSFYNVTNGVGTMKVVKEGTGTWQLSGNVQLEGGVEVKGGTLKIANNFSFYRFNIIEPYTNRVDGGYGVRMFGIWDAAGNLLTKDMGDEEKMGLGVDAAFKLNPGETAYSGIPTIRYNNGTGYTREWGKGGLMYDTLSTGYSEINPKNGYQLFRVTASTLPTITDPNTWLRFVMRFPEGTAPAMSYDMMAEENWGGRNQGMELKAFSMDGSTDGNHWTELSRVTDNAAWGSCGNWYSTKKNSRTLADGFKLSASRDAGVVTATIPSVSVAAGATLDVEPALGVTAQNMAFDVAAGGGTVKGISFAEGGTLSVTGEIPQEGLPLGMTFKNVQGLDNLKGWSVSDNGHVRNVLRLAVRPDGQVEIVTKGIRLFFR